MLPDPRRVSFADYDDDEGVELTTFSDEVDLDSDVEPEREIRMRPPPPTFLEILKDRMNYLVIWGAFAFLGVLILGLGSFLVVHNLNVTHYFGIYCLFFFSTLCGYVIDLK